MLIKGAIHLQSHSIPLNRDNIFRFTDFLPNILTYHNVPCYVVHQIKLIILKSIFIENLSNPPFKVFLNCSCAKGDHHHHDTNSIHLRIHFCHVITVQAVSASCQSKQTDVRAYLPGHQMACQDLYTGGTQPHQHSVLVSLSTLFM